MNSDSKKVQSQDSQRSLTAREQTGIDKMKKKSFGKAKSFFRTTETDNRGALELNVDDRLEHNEGLKEAYSRIMDATGAGCSDVGLNFLVTAGGALTSAKADNQELINKIDIVGQVMRTLKPEDEYEGQLVAQLAVLHQHAMDWLGRAVRTERVDFANTYLNGASKLLARHHETLDALLKYRRRGEQRVYVEHVHVHNGGQAIVGPVTTGGGVDRKSEEGPHASV